MPKVPVSRGGVEIKDSILAGKPVLAQTWADAARLHNWVAGRGMQLVPCMCPAGGVGNTTGPNLASGANDAYAFRFWARPRYQAVRRQWAFSLSTSGSSVDITTPDGTSHTVGVARSSYGNAVLLPEVLSSQSNSDDDMTLTIEPNGADVFVNSIGCVEHPRVSLETDSNDEGTEFFKAGAPILRKDLDNMITGAATADLGRRVLLNWAVPYHDGNAVITTFAATTSSSTMTPIFDSALSLPALGRAFYPGDTLSTITARCYAWVSDGTGAVRVTTRGGSTGNTTVSSTTPAWTAEILDSIDAEDVTTWDGRRGGQYDTVTIEFKHNNDAVTNEIYVASVAIWED